MEKKFKEILKHYLTGKSTPLQDKVIEDFIYNMQTTNKSSNDLITDQKLKQKIRLSILKKIQPRVRKKRKYVFLKSTFVVLLIGLSISAIVNYSQQPLNYTTYLESKTITLSDGSFVELYPHSSLEVNKQYNKQNRLLSLKGKAFFKVTPNKELAFLVKGQRLTTKVLGTSFLLDEQSQQNSVKVTTGKVEVATENQRVVLTKDQSVYLYSDGLFKYSADNQIISSTSDVLLMNKASYQLWSTTLEKEFKVKIQTNKAFVKQLRITADYRDSKLIDILDSFCFIHNLSYSIKNNIITIN